MLGFAHQLQQCASSSGSCSNTDDATDSTYIVQEAVHSRWLRVVVTASNVPAFSRAKAASAITSAVGAKPGDAAADDQCWTASLPQSRDTLHVEGWLFNPAGGIRELGFTATTCGPSAIGSPAPPNNTAY
jgi:hypothetical protein